MTNSTRIAGLLGPTLIAISITEWMNLGVFTAAIGPSFAPHVYLNGTLLFVAGLAIVRAHHLWTRGWPVLVTLVGWVVMLDGWVGGSRRYRPSRPDRTPPSCTLRRSPYSRSASF